MNRSLGLLLVAGGAAAVLVGVLVWSGALSWFGRLPGDIHIQSGDTRVSIPLVSMLVVSAVLTLVVNLIARWL